MFKDTETTHDFYKGNYGSALKKAEQGKPLDSVVRIACLVFSGANVEADLALKDAKLDREQRMAALFFVATGRVRQSRYAEAEKIFAENAFRFRRSIHPHARFFAFQGLAFFRFYSGRFRSAKRLAAKAAAIARSIHFSYGEALALQGHGFSSLETGDVREGLSSLKQAKDSAKKMGSGGLEATLTVNLALNEAAYGIAKTVTSLRRLEKTKISNTYTVAEIHLELVRQLVLRGQVSEAKALLEKTYGPVHKNQNRRQAALLNLRAAWIQSLQGESSQALHLLRLAKLNLHKEIDLLLWAKLTGLEIQVLKEQSLDSEAEQVDRDNATDLRFLQSAAQERYRSRLRGEPPRSRTGEDPLGDLIDRVRDPVEEGVLEEVIEKGYLHFLRKPLKIRPGEREMIFGLPSSSVLLADRSGLKIISSLSRIHRRLLEKLGSRETSKETLIEDVWGYRYDPLRHDGLLYSAIKELRSKLGADWIGFGEDGYFLNGSLRHWKGSVVKERPAGASSRGMIQELLKGHDFNVRQMRILEDLMTGQRSFWTQRDCRKSFHCSTMTATRDLSQLLSAGLLQEARARRR